MFPSIFTYYILIFSFLNFAQGQELSPTTLQGSNTPFSRNTLELDYLLFSPEIFYRTGEDNISMTPKAAGQPGLRFSGQNISFSFNKSIASENSQSGGVDLAYTWDNSFVQTYHAWSSGYRVQMNPNSAKKLELGDRDNMTGSSDGILYLKGFDDAARFSLLTHRGPLDQAATETPLQYNYQFLVDRTAFEDSSALIPGQTANRKERTSIIPGLGAMISQTTSVGYVITSCSTGIGIRTDHR